MNWKDISGIMDLLNNNASSQKNFQEQKTWSVKQKFHSTGQPVAHRPLATADLIFPHDQNYTGS